KVVPLASVRAANRSLASGDEHRALRVALHLSVRTECRFRLLPGCDDFVCAGPQSKVKGNFCCVVAIVATESKTVFPGDSCTPHTHVVNSGELPHLRAM